MVAWGGCLWTCGVVVISTHLAFKLYLRAELASMGLLESAMNKKHVVGTLPLSSHATTDARRLPVPHFFITPPSFVFDAEVMHGRDLESALVEAKRKLEDVESTLAGGWRAVICDICDICDICEIVRL